MGVSTTHRINLSMWIVIYSFSDTYYVWAACDETPDKSDGQNVLYGTQITLCWALFHGFCSFVLRHLRPVNEVKLITPIKLHQIFICDETCFSWDQPLAFAFLLFHLWWHVKKSDFVLHHGFQTPRKRRKRSASCLVLLSVSRCLDPVVKHESIVLDILHEKV